MNVYVLLIAVLANAVIFTSFYGARYVKNTIIANVIKIGAFVIAFFMIAELPYIFGLDHQQGQSTTLYTVYILLGGWLLSRFFVKKNKGN